MSDDSVVESVLLRKLIAGKRFEVFSDHHEDYEATGYYIYVVQREDRLLGRDSRGNQGDWPDRWGGQY